MSLICDINVDFPRQTEQTPVMKMASILEDLQAFTCTYCGQHFSTFDARKRHVMRHKSKYRRWIKAKKRSSFIRSVLAPYQCAVCNASFLKISSLENHVKVAHILVAAYGCKVCTFASFQDRDSYVRHVADHVKPTRKLKTPYQCVYCKQCFVLNSVLGKHLKAKHKDMKIFEVKYNWKARQCGYCKQCFAGKHLGRHIKNHETGGPYYCKFCRQCFNNFSSLSQHAQSMHTANPYHCKEWDCRLRFSDFSALAHHMDLMHRRDTYSCPICFHRFSDYPSMARHGEQTHKQSQTETPKVPLAPYRCQICRRTHYNVTDLLIHASVIHGHTWADLAVDLAACLQRPVSMSFQDDCPQETSESGRMVRLARSTHVTTNDRIAEPETCSLGMVSGSDNVMDKCKTAKTEEESSVDLSCRASSQASRSHQCQPSPGLKVGPSAATKKTGTEMSVIPGNMSSPDVYVSSLHTHQFVTPSSPYMRFMHNVLLKRRADFVNLKPWQVDNIIRYLWDKLPESDPEKARLKWEYKVNQTVYINAVKKRIQRGKDHDHTYTRPPGSHQTIALNVHVVEHEEEKEIVDVVTVTEETQPQSQILSKQKAATCTCPYQRHLKRLVGSQNGTVVPTKIALSSTCMQPVVCLVNMKSLLLGVFCKPKRKLTLLDANGKPRRRQPYLDGCKKCIFSVSEHKRRAQERFSYRALREQVPAITSKERVKKIDILKHSTEYIHTLWNEEEQLLKVKEMERQRHEQLQEQLHYMYLQNGNVVHQCFTRPVLPAKCL